MHTVPGMESAPSLTDSPTQTRHTRNGHTRMTRAAPNNPQFVFDQCEALMQRGDRARALKLLTELEARGQNDEEVLSRLADFYGRIGEGEKVLMFLGAANRDPRRWDHPDRYDITRRTSGHVGFGSGIHMCVGQLVARLEGEVMLAALARKVASIEINGEPKRRYNNTLRGLDSLPVTITPA